MLLVHGATSSSTRHREAESRVFGQVQAVAATVTRKRSGSVAPASKPHSNASGRPRTLPSHIFFLMNISHGLPWPGGG